LELVRGMRYWGFSFFFFLSFFPSCYQVPRACVSVTGIGGFSWLLVFAMQAGCPPSTSITRNLVRAYSTSPAPSGCCGERPKRRKLASWSGCFGSHWRDEGSMITLYHTDRNRPLLSLNCFLPECSVSSRPRARCSLRGIRRSRSASILDGWPVKTCHWR
jgi:hypothetical protein